VSEKWNIEYGEKDGKAAIVFSCNEAECQKGENVKEETVPDVCETADAVSITANTIFENLNALGIETDYGKELRDMIKIMLACEYPPHDIKNVLSVMIDNGLS
jgi:hypothetical protein